MAFGVVVVLQEFLAQQVLHASDWVVFTRA
jgi:hypothetical protein